MLVPYFFIKILQQSPDVSNGKQYHEQQEKRKTEAVDPRFHFFRYRRSFYLFNDDHEKSAAIKRRKRNEIHDREIQRNDAEQLNKIDSADASRFFGNSENTDRADDAREKRRMYEKIFDQLPERLEYHPGENE